MHELWKCNRCGECCTNLTGGLDLLPEEIQYFPKNRYKPQTGYGKTKHSIKILSYSLIGKCCPLYDKTVGCTIYENRPLICKSFPISLHNNFYGIDHHCKNAPEDETPMRVKEEYMLRTQLSMERQKQIHGELLSSGLQIWEFKGLKWKRWKPKRRNLMPV